MSLQFKQLKQPVTEQDNHKNLKNHFRKDTLHSYTQYSRLIAISTVFLISVICWCPQHWHQSWRQYCTLPLTPHYAVPQLQSPFTPPSPLALCYMQHTDSPWQLSVSLLALHAYCISGLFFSPPVSAVYPLLEVSAPFSQGKWHTSTLEVGGFMGHHTISGCCPLLQYFIGFRATELLQGVCLIQYCSGGSCPLPPLPLGLIIYALIKWVNTVRMHGNKDSFLSFWGWKILQTCWNLFGIIFIDFSLWYRWGVLYTFLVQII